MMMTRKIQERRERTRLIFELWPMIEQSIPMRIKMERYNREMIKKERKFKTREEENGVTESTASRIKLRIKPSSKGRHMVINALTYLARTK
jgi:uncharacterized protein YerC